jgi:hypothetical protein
MVPAGPCVPSGANGQAGAAGDEGPSGLIVGERPARPARMHSGDKGGEFSGVGLWSPKMG